MSGLIGIKEARLLIQDTIFSRRWSAGKRFRLKDFGRPNRDHAYLSKALTQEPHMGCVEVTDSRGTGHPTYYTLMFNAVQDAENGLASPGCDLCAIQIECKLKQLADMKRSRRGIER